MFERVPYNYIPAHISDALSWTVQLDIGTYVRCFFVFYTTRYWHISL